MTEGDTERTVSTARDDPSNAPADGDADPETGTDPRGRDVEVPFEVYKAVTVFSTLFAVGAVVVGFVLVDWGTDRATADLPDVNVAITLAGLASIALGAATYAFSTRFRASGMGNAKDDAD
jgi:hypothetical protein